MMPNYEIIIYWSKTDEAFIAVVPELPGCMADGVSYVDAVKNVQVVMREWIAQAYSSGQGESPIHAAPKVPTVRRVVDPSSPTLWT